MFDCMYYYTKLLTIVKIDNNYSENVANLRYFGVN